MFSKSKDISSRAIIGGGLGIVIVYYALRELRQFKRRNHLKSLRIKKQKERKEKLESLQCDYSFGPDRAAIVSLTFDQLVQKLQSRELKARQVLEAYVAKAVVATREFNCVTEFIEQAFATADELDALPTVKGPLHGIPICVKDDHHIKGMDSTLGLSINLYKPKSRDAVVIEVLEEAGAIPFCITNLPQTTFSMAAGGALLGTGSDIGGSVRIPAHFCGIATLKPTSGRISSRGLNASLELCAGLEGVSGMLAAEAKTLAMAYSVLLGGSKQFKKDPATVPMPWNVELFKSTQPLRIGYFTTLAFFPTIGDIPETVLKAKTSLALMGHTLVPFELPDPWHIMEVFASLSFADGGNQNYQRLKFDQVSPVAAKFVAGRSFLSYITGVLSSLLGKTSSRDFAGNPAAQRSEILWEYLARARAIKYDVIDRMNNLDLDAILCPAFPFAASKVQDTDTLLNGIVYTVWGNLIDFPCGVVPFGKESATKIDDYDDEGDNYLKLAKQGARLAKDMPIGVQIIAKPYQEEIVVRLLVELENLKVESSLQE
ncbi:unnamed protein product [Allacma fusca]|uniref:Amidase domain-containing protein n=1 Tax=Allacma fusca TaxID=39272 RepID=A0A8J2PF33_9HEXA|nr:unnamed protein product [Allacma fusca]